jgi:peptidoglycan/LPS O-acetylase OafA/YrhL
MVSGSDARGVRVRLSRTAPRSIGAVFDPRGNAITPLRLVLASSVVLSHAFVAGGFGFDPLYQITGGQMEIGTVAVIAFFALSGFLLTRSRETSHRGSFARNRALRIVPGYWICLIVIVVVVAPLASRLGGSASIGDVVAWAGREARFDPLQTVVPGMYGTIGKPDLVDAPLWTLPVEVGCYLLLWLAPKRWLTPVVIALFALATVLHLSTGGNLPFLYLPVAFMVGACIYLGRERVPATGVLAGALVTASAVSACFGALGLVAPFALAYVAIWVGTLARASWPHDVSYGVYIYGWPIQQLLTMTGLSALGFAPYLVVSAIVIGVVAYASARLVEEPALRLRHRPSFQQVPST